MEKSNEEMWKGKGLWKTLQEEMDKGNVKEYNVKKLTLDDIKNWMEEAHKEDIKRRERLDKEYTDVGTITLEEIDKIIAEYGGIDNVPNGLMAKITQ